MSALFSYKKEEDIAGYTPLASLDEDEALQDQIRHQVRRKANGTFLWVALVFQELEGLQSWDALDVLEEMPADLVSLYHRMLQHIQQLPRKNPELCRLVLATAILAYRPLHLLEVGALSGLPGQISNKAQSVRKIVEMCGSFLTIREDYVYIVHQFAKDYLREHTAATIFRTAFTSVHYSIFSRSINVMSETLRRDIYSLRDPGLPIDNVKPPDPDPLSPARYSCIYWVDHLSDAHSNASVGNDLQNGGIVHTFLQEKFLFWVEALALLGSMSEGGLAMSKLETLLRGIQGSDLTGLVRDSWRFIASYGRVIGSVPLQAYGSALVFSPRTSEVRTKYWEERLPFIKTVEGIGERNICLQTLEGHSDLVNAVAFSPDGKTVASASWDHTVQLWDAATGAHRQTLETGSFVRSLSFSDDGRYLKTDRGFLSISTAADLAHMSQNQEPLDSALFVDDKWVIQDGKRLLWLPTDYRATSVAVYGDLTVLGHKSGGMTFLWCDLSSS